MGKMFALYLGGSALIALIQYISGRIILPEMGLDVPGYGPWLVLALLMEMPLILVNAFLKVSGENRF